MPITNGAIDGRGLCWYILRNWNCGANCFWISNMRECRRWANGFCLRHRLHYSVRPAGYSSLKSGWRKERTGLVESSKELRNGPERLHCITLKSHWHSVTLINGTWREVCVCIEGNSHRAVNCTNKCFTPSIVMGRCRLLCKDGVLGSSFQLVLSAVAGDEGTIQKC